MTEKTEEILRNAESSKTFHRSLSAEFESESEEEKLLIGHLSYSSTKTDKDKLILAIVPGIEFNIFPGRLDIFEQTINTERYLIGPIEVITPIGPGESIEVNLTVQREITQEESQSYSIEDRKKILDSTEVVNNLSDRLTRSHTKISSLSMSGGTPVINGTLSTSETVSEVSEKIKKITTTVTQSAEREMRNATQIMTRKATRDYQEESSRRLIENKDTSKAINVGIRRVFRKVKLKTKKIESKDCIIARFDIREFHLPMLIADKSGDLILSKPKHEPKQFSYAQIDLKIPVGRIGKRTEIDSNGIYPQFDFEFNLPTSLNPATDHFLIDGDVLPIDAQSICRLLELHEGIDLVQVKDRSSINTRLDNINLEIIEPSFDSSNKKFKCKVLVAAPKEDSNTRNNPNYTVPPGTFLYPSLWFDGGSYSAGGRTVEPNLYSKTRINYFRFQTTVGQTKVPSDLSDLESHKKDLLEFLSRILAVRKHVIKRKSSSLRREEKEILTQMFLDRFLRRDGFHALDQKTFLYSDCDIDNAFILNSHEVDDLQNANQDALVQAALSEEMIKEGGQIDEEFLKIYDEFRIYNWDTIQVDADLARNKLLNSKYVYLAVPIKSKATNSSRTSTYTKMREEFKEEFGRTVNENLVNAETEVSIKVPVSGFIYDVLG